MTGKARLEKEPKASFDAQVMEMLRQDTFLMIKRFGDQFLDTACPVCSSDQRHLEATVWDLDYQRCEGCGLVYMSPFPTDEARSWYLANSKGLAFWRENLPAATQGSRTVMYTERADFIERHTAQSPSRRNLLVEIGAGNGELAEVILERGLFAQVVLIEPQPLKLSLPRCRVLQSELAGARLTDLADVAAAFEVIEHVNDPRKFLRDIGKLIRADGLLVMSTPNTDGLEISRLGALSSALIFDHVRLFNPRSMGRLLDREGWDLVALETPGEFDVERIRKHLENGTIDLKADPALRFICRGDATLRREFQTFLRKELLSGHMKLVARKR